MNTTNNDVVIAPGTRAISDTTRHTTVAGLLFLFDVTTTIFGRRNVTGFFAAVPGVHFQGNAFPEVRDAAIVWLREQVGKVDADFLQPSPGNRVRLDSLDDGGRPYFVLHRRAGATIAIAQTIVALLAFAAIRGYVVFSNE